MTGVKAQSKISRSEHFRKSVYLKHTKQLKQKLDVIQRRMVRYVFSMHHMSHVDTDNLREISWLSVTDRVRYFKLCLVFRIKAGDFALYQVKRWRLFCAAAIGLLTLKVEKGASNLPKLTNHNDKILWLLTLPKISWSG